MPNGCKIIIQIDCAGLGCLKIITGKYLGGFIQDGKKNQEKKRQAFSISAIPDLPRTANHMVPPSSSRDHEYWRTKKKKS